MKYGFYILVLTGLFFSGCSDDDNSVNCDNIDLVVDYQTEQNAISEAQFAYLIDDSQENCEEAKRVVTEYLEILEPFEGCEWEEEKATAYDETVNELRAYLDTLSC